MEVQMVHYKEKLGDWDKALTSLDWDSIAIVSTFFYVSRTIPIHHKTPHYHSHSLLYLQLELEQRISNPTMDIIANAIQNITQPNTEIRVLFVSPHHSFLLSKKNILGEIHSSLYISSW